MRSILANRSLLARAPRVVVKIGSSSLTAQDGTLATSHIAALVDVLGRRVRDGGQVVLVSSGAIAAGMRPMGLTSRPVNLSLAQAAASVGQGALLARYTQEFARHGITVGQVLLTADDFVRRRHYVNARRAFASLLRHGVLPVVNENDTVATDEIRFGDNDRLAALVAQLVGADALVLLTDVDGLHDGPPSRPGSRQIPYVGSMAEIAHVVVTTRGSSVGTGGMVTKLDAAAAATGSGIPVVLTNAENAAAALAGEQVGTWFAATGRRAASRALWLAHAAVARGVLDLDAGAARAVRENGRSLLAAGVTGVAGVFEAGDVVELRDPDGAIVGRGLAGYASAEVARLAGKRSEQIAATGLLPRPVVHRDDLTLVRAQR